METDNHKNAGTRGGYCYTSFRGDASTRKEWAYRCDDCAWICVAPYDPVSCPSCGGDTNRAPSHIALPMIGK